jgi:hypothetical protein
VRGDGDVDGCVALLDDASGARTNGSEGGLNGVKPPRGRGQHRRSLARRKHGCLKRLCCGCVVNVIAVPIASMAHGLLLISVLREGKKADVFVIGEPVYFEAPSGRHRKMKSFFFCGCLDFFRVEIAATSPQHSAVREILDVKWPPRTDCMDIQ